MNAYTITGSLGDTAEATDLEAALVAARTLVDDGNASADVTGPTGAWIATATATKHGTAVHLIQGMGR